MFYKIKIYGTYENPLFDIENISKILNINIDIKDFNNN